MNRDEIETLLSFLGRVRFWDEGKPDLHDMKVMLKEALRSQPQCSYCGGNDSDMPCAYPGDKVSGCLRDRRLAAPPADGVPRAGVLVPEGKLAALQSDLTEQCRLNGMGQQREARLMAQLQEAERKLKRICKCEFSAGGVLKKSCEYHNQREVAVERNALEQAAKVCIALAEDADRCERENGWDCENAIRALMKEGDENV